MDEGRYIVRMLPENRSSMRPMEYANGVLNPGQQTAQPSLQISYNQPVAQQYGQPAYQRQSVGVQPIVSGGSPILYHASRQPYVVYQDQTAPPESSSAYITTTIPRASAPRQTAALPPQGELANSARYLVLDQSQQPLVGVQRGALPALVAPPSDGVPSQPGLVQTIAEVHHHDVTEASATTEVTRARPSNATHQNVADDPSAKHSADLTATRSKGRKQKPKADTLKASKQIPAAKTNGVKARVREEKPRLVERSTKASESRYRELDSDDVVEFDRTKSQPRVSLANDIFVEQVQAAREAHKNTKSTARRQKLTESTGKASRSAQVSEGGQTTKTRVRAVQTGHDERPQSAAAGKIGASKPTSDQKKKTRTVSAQTQTEVVENEDQPKRVMTNTAEVQTEVVPANERDVDDHVGQEQVMWTMGGTQTEADPEESEDVFNGTLSSSSGYGLYARVIKPSGAVSTTVERSDAEDLNQMPPPIPTKREESLKKDVLNDERNINDGDVLNDTTKEDHKQTVNGIQNTALLTQEPNVAARNTEQNLTIDEDNNTTDENVGQKDVRHADQTIPSLENPYSVLPDLPSGNESSEWNGHEQLTETDTSERPDGGMVDNYASINNKERESAESAVGDTRSADQETASSTGSREQLKNDKPRQSSTALGLPAGFLLNGSIKAYFHCCDITKLKTYVIVSAATAKLKHEHGVAKALAKAGGKDLEKDSKKYVKKNGPVAVSEVVSTRPGKLQCAHVFHAVGPVFKDYSDKNECRMKLKQTYDNIFHACNLHRVPSIAIPLISTGRFGVPYQYIASCLYESLVTAAANANLKYPKEVHVVNLESAVILPVVVSFSTQQAEADGKVIEVQPLDKREVRDVLRERVVHKKLVSSAAKKIKEMKKTADSKKTNDVRKSNSNKS